jgi:hypothetical protein
VVNELIRIDLRDRKHPLVQSTAKKLKRNSDIETVKAAFDYVVRLVPYKSDPADREHITAPIHLIAGNVVGEDCESMVLLLSTLLNVLGIETKYTVLAWRKRQFTHVILKAKTSRGWIELDPTQGAKGFGQSIPKEKIIRSKDYGVPKMEMKVQTLEDRYMPNVDYLNDCGCNSHLSDCGGKCGCGGKCKGSSSKPTNQNIINIGNEISKVLGLTGSGQNTERVIERDVPRPYPVYKEKIVKQMIPDALTRERVEAIVKHKDVPVRVVQAPGRNYIYRDMYY